MSAPIELSALDLSALLCSKVCHDVINPVAAMENGFQLLEMDQKAESREEAMKLIRHSAIKASAKLEFARIAFGSSGSPTAQIDVGDAGDLGKRLFEPEVKVEFNIPKTLMAKNRVKLLLNMMLIAGGAVPRGCCRAEVAKPRLPCAAPMPVLSSINVMMFLTGSTWLSASKLRPFARMDSATFIMDG